MEALGDFGLTIFWAFALVAYLMILYVILSDLFRDGQLAGWWKAVWIVLLIFVPFLTALVYVIARGSGMQRRAQAHARQWEAEQDDYLRRTLAVQDPAAQIARAKQLHDQGVISDDEFQRLKTKALG